MDRFAATGALIGICLGIFFHFISHQIIYGEFLFSLHSRFQLVQPMISTSGGSLFSVGLIFPLFLGIFGWVIGSIVYKIVTRGK